LIGGFDFNGGFIGNKGVIFTSLKPWGERHGEEHSAEALKKCWGYIRQFQKRE